MTNNTPTEPIRINVHPELAAELKDWSNPVQLRIVDDPAGGFLFEVRPLVRMGGVSGAYYIDQEEETP